MITIISFILFVLYMILSIYKNDRLPVSLSDTYYLWPKWVFPIMMVIMAFSVLPYWLEMTANTDYQFLSFLACAGLLFVADAPDFRNDKNQYPIHVISAYIAAGMTVLSLTFVSGYWWIFPITLIIEGLFEFKNIKNCYIWILEISIIISTYYNIFLYWFK